MGIVFANNAASTLLSSISDTETSISVIDGSSFPELAAGDYFYLTLANAAETAYEIVKVTSSQSGDFGVVRAQDGTVAQSWPVGTKAEIRMCRIAAHELRDRPIDTFSTTETLTNKVWINGKPIYRKIINLGALPNATTKTVAHNITGATYFLPVIGVATSGTVYVSLPYSSPSGMQYGISINVNGSNVDIVTGVDRSTWSGYAILEYTK